jgi:hypothetical protein
MPKNKTKRKKKKNKKEMIREETSSYPVMGVTVFQDPVPRILDRLPQVIQVQRTQSTN